MTESIPSSRKRFASRTRRNSKAATRAKNIIAIVGALVLVAVILWIDFATSLWADLVIVAGLAAGLVTFLLTVLVLDKIVARSTERKWAPVNRFALTEFLHALADEKHSQITRGHIVARSLPLVDTEGSTMSLHEQLDHLRHQIMKERRLLADPLSRWAEFLASSGSNEQILRHISDLALQLDRVRDLSVEVEDGGVTPEMLRSETTRCNDLLLALEAELRAQIAHEDELEH